MVKELSVHQRSVLKLFSEGYSRKDIAAMFHVSAKAIDDCKRNIKLKTGCYCDALLTRYALKEGITTLDAPKPQYP